MEIENIKLNYNEYLQLIWIIIRQINTPQEFKDN